MAFEFSYTAAGPTLQRFHASAANVRLLMGHVGSGKSVACAIEIFVQAMRQKPNKDGIRYSRCAVIRNTTPQLKTTTIKTWLEWFPENIFGPIKWDPPISHHIRIGDVDLEIIFLALDRPEDMRRLLSLELTFAWINEAREISKSIIDGVDQRVGRYPSAKGGNPGPTRPCVWMDTNPPSEDHWWPIMAGDVPPPRTMSAEEIRTMVKPKGWEWFTQPAAMLPVYDSGGDISGYVMNPERENQWKPGGGGIKDEYYERQLAGKSPEWINVYILNRYGNIFDGRRVYSGFNRKVHVAREPLQFLPGHPIYVGIDFGLTPAAVFGQKLRNRWLIQHELVTTDMAARDFAAEIKHLIGRCYPDAAEFIFRGDPAGDQRAQTDERTPFDILRNEGINARPASTNDPAVRIDAVSKAINSMEDGNPCYLVSPECTSLIAAKEGGYHYKEGSNTPNKNQFSHVSDAEQYMFDGAGDLRSYVKDGQRVHQPTVKATKWSVFGNKSRLNANKKISFSALRR